MPYTKRVWVDRSVEKPLTYNIVDNVDGTKSLVPAEGTIITAGTPITAANMNAHEDGIFNAVESAESAVATTATFTNKVVGAVVYAYKNLGGAL